MYGNEAEQCYLDFDLSIDSDSYHETMIDVMCG